MLLRVNKYILIFALINLFLFIKNECFSQNIKQIKIDSSLSVSGYMEAYYGYDFQNPDNNRRPDFLYNFTRHNEVNLNIGVIKLNYSQDRIRGSFGLMVGNYVTENLSAEPLAMRNIYEANIGVKLHKTQDLWLDLGVMESNLGFESVIGANNWLMTRSLLAENSPYYLNAAKLSYKTKNQKWMFTGLFSNGWQVMVDGHPSFGHQVQWYPNKKWTINSSSFFGQVNLPTSSFYLIGDLKQRFFHNFYLKYDGQKIGLIMSADIGFDQDFENPNNYNTWSGLALVTRFKVSDKIAVSARGELLYDPYKSVVLSPNYNEFFNIGTSLNFDYQIHNRVLWRIESCVFSSKHPIYRYNNKPTTSNYYLGTSLTLKIGDI